MQDLVSYRIGIDIGGTFTDFAMVDDDSGDVTLEKILTTPHDPSVAVLEGVSRLLGRGKVSITQVEVDHSWFHACNQCGDRAERGADWNACHQGVW